MIGGKKGNTYLNLQLKGVGLFLVRVSKGLRAWSVFF